MNQPIVQLLAKHFLVVAVLMVGSLIVRRRSAAFRNCFWVIGFAWVLLLPLFVAQLPHWTVERDVPHYMPVERPVVFVQNTRTYRAAASESLPFDPLAVVEDSKQPEVPSVAPTPLGNRNAGPIVLGIYGVGVLIWLAAMVESLLSVARIRRSSQPPSVESSRELQSAAKTLGLRRVPDLLINPDVAVPMTFWMGRSVVVAPSNDISRAVLLHECAHIRRGDWFAQFFARTVRSVFWFDPILLFAERQMRAASEQAADDIVVSAGIEPVDYAEELYGIAASSGKQRFEAGLAIVGPGGLKDRIGQILRIGPRVVRLPFRWAAITMLLGALTVLPFAAFHYIRTDFPASDNGLIDFGNGYWIRLLAVTDLDGRDCVSWNMKGERITLPADLFPDRSTTRVRSLLFATNINDDSEPVDLRVGAASAGQAQAPSIPGRSFGKPDSIANETVWSVTVQSGSWPRGSALLLTTPTQPFSSPIATARYRGGRLESSNNPRLFPAYLPPHSDARVTVPAGLSGRVELDIQRTTPRGQSGEITFSQPGDAFSVSTTPDITQMTLRNQPSSRQFLLTNVPNQPLSENVAPAEAPEGVTFNDARQNQFTLPDAEVLTLEAVSRADGRRPISWSPQGLMKRGAVHGNSIEDLFAQGRFNGLSATEYGRLNSSWVPRIVSFTVSGHAGRLRTQQISLFDAGGFRADHSFDMRIERNQSETHLLTAVSDPAKPQDLIVRIADPAGATRIRIPIDEAYADRHFESTPKYSYPGKTLVGLRGRRLPRIVNLISNSKDQVSIGLLDAKARSVETMSSNTDGQLDEYFFDKRDIGRIRTIEVVTMPYIYIRFPRVAMNPAG